MSPTSLALLEKLTRSRLIPEQIFPQILDIVSDNNGMIEVPNMWPNRYDLDVGPPPNEVSEVAGRSGLRVV